MDPSETRSSTYRIHGLLAEGGDPTECARIRLFDLETAETLWAALGGSHGDASLGRAWPGAVLDADLSGPTPGGVWSVDSATVKRETTLSLLAPTDPLLDGVWRAWWDRDPDTRRTVEVHTDNGRPVCEIHVSAPPPGTDAEAVWDRMLAGEFSFEPWFDGLVELDDPAAHLTVVNPARTDVFVFFATPASAPTESVRRRRERLGGHAFPEG